MVPKMMQAGKRGRCSLGLVLAIMALSAIALAQGQSRAKGNWSGQFSSHNFASFPVSIRTGTPLLLTEPLIQPELCWI
jgi:hypothetical protein